MKSWFFILLLFFVFLTSCSTHQHDDIKSVNALHEIPTPEEFSLGVGDEIDFSVWRHDDLERKLVVDPVGNVYFPLIGEVLVEGMTLSELRKEVSHRLEHYLVDPTIDIHVTTIKSQKVHIFGEVKSPSTIALGQKMFIWEAIASAGGFTNDANKNDVLLIRTVDGTSTPFHLDLQKMIENGDLNQGYYLANNDVLYIPPSSIVNVERFMTRVNNIINPFVTLERSIILWPNLVDALEDGSSSTNITVSP